ncbi:MAG: sodium:alanine symporter family protein [Candidatus Dadabacteria bacterium]|nr:sodium:alanine symporter family protein [Candidatus Dadabacteria bacterium]NIS08483.1 sodium:alanine symporter family protein [Candidatus Dadabacteria bacterium]NIY21971.1 amino acid carrier protein [Candidatus Dadabacteria bacterium]
MQEQILGLLNQISGYVWGPVLIIMLLGTGIYLTIILRGIQFRALIPSLLLAFTKGKRDEKSEGDISHFQALMTALSATVGVGNIAGVATAIAFGGPGALFWMWITGLVGMATKYSEAVLAVKYREQDKLGTMSGGPMYYISKGLGMKWLGSLFAIFGAIAAFGIGNMVQSNSVAHALESAFGITHWITGVVLCVATGFVIVGGIKSIAKVTSAIVPFMIILYLIGAFISLIINLEQIPHAFYLIFHHAFNPTAASGGFAGAVIQQTLRMGVARGIFSNESGLGSSPIAAAAAKTTNPVRQALVSMSQTFIDTIVVCTFTGLVIISSGLWTSGQTGAALSALAFEKGVPNDLGADMVSVCLAFFAYSTLLGWSYYGEKCIEFIFKERVVVPYRIIFTVFVLVGAIIKLDIVWTFADIMNGLMAFPNLVGLILLSRVVVEETKLYLAKEIGKK